MATENFQREFDELSKKLQDPSVLASPPEYQRTIKRYGELKSLLAKSKLLEGKNDAAIMEIRAGAGGEESALFAQELYRMYSKYAERIGWKTRVLDSKRTELGGIKEVIFEISGKDSLSKMRTESGVHRVQRIPETEKGGRVHTSTVSIAVLPRAKPVDVEIKPEDIRADTYRASGPGGQNVNKTSSAVRLTHIPSGIVVSSQEERQQQQNRELAMTILRSKLLHIKEEHEAKSRGELRKHQIGTGERSEKIRTYNFPQDRMTDHRIGKNWSNLKSIMDGDIDRVIESLRNV